MIAIEKEIIRDENGDPKSVVIPWRQYRQMAQELGLPENDLPWSPEKLGAEAQRMIDEPDRAKADEIWEDIIRGFYGK